ncbi:S8 family serine peptidase [Faecalimonas umbilicata]|nr:S8 family serine peptidase [Faecalimonas umbilicata]
MCKWKKVISVVLSLLLISSTVNVYAADKEDAGEIVEESENSDGKIAPELQEKMNVSSEEELISVWLWLKPIEKEKIDQVLLEKTGMNSEVYEDEERFEEEILPQIEAEVEAELGYEEAHSVVVQENLSDIASADLQSINGKEENAEYAMTPIDIAVSEEFDEYVAARRGIVKQEYLAANDKFIQEKNISTSADNIIYKSQYTSTLIVKATKSEILDYADSEMVESISFYTDEIQVSDADISLEQAGIYCEGGTGHTISGGWVAYDGLGIKIGILEAECGKYDSTASQLVGNSKIHFVDNIRSDGTTIESTVSSHATMVTSIIAGKTASVGGRTYTGVVPNATIYQMPVEYPSDCIRGFQQLVDKGVLVINYSGGSSVSEELYSSYDKEIDRLIAETGTVFVNSAGNTGGNITSPGKGLNVITVGNAATKTSSTTSAISPYTMASSSAYVEASYLPNKPDIAAPGTMISYVKSAGVLSTASGTSFAAPIVTGVVAQMMQAKSSLKTNPTAVKAALLLGSDKSKISTNNNVSVEGYLKDKSGAGFVDAINAVTNAFGAKKIALTTTTDVNTDRYYFTAGQKIRAAMVFNKKNDSSISSLQNLDDFDIQLRPVSGDSILTLSDSSRNNVEIIECTIRTSGYYVFCVKKYRVVDSDNPPEISIVFTVN